MHAPLRILLALAALVLVPAVAYVAVEANSASEQERLLEQAYDEQLETVLFVVNQHAWEVAQARARRIAQTLVADPDSSARALQALVRDDEALAAAFLAPLDAETAPLVQATADDLSPLPQTLRLPDGLGDQLQRDLEQADFRRIVPLDLPVADGFVGLATIAETAAEPLLAGLVLDADAFVRSVVRPKLEEVSRGRLPLAVVDTLTGRVLCTTGQAPVADLRLRRPLWLLPGHVLAADPGQGALGTILRERFARNLTLIGLLTLALVAAAAGLYRTLRREVDLAGEQVRLARQEMELAEMKGEFVQNVSHELRTPLALIRMYAETLDAGRVTDEAGRKRYVGTILAESERLSRLVNAILSFARVERGQATGAPLDLAEIARAVVSRYREPLAERGFTLHADLHAAPVCADADALTEALVNLLENAAKYAGLPADAPQDDPRRRIVVRSGTTQAGAFVEVEDAGPGIAPDDQARIFEPFYRVQRGLVHETQGTGLGLSLVDRTARAAGGHVVLQSAVGQGSRFRLLLPARSTRAPSPPPAVSSSTA
jgi:two-component system phosphate regulon sensor histidine kinase PhoR